ncbi:NAD(P)/FAD-dependent oxidoreductase [Frigidibacter sp. MR17.24]|uniref:NAD(P)/FAD-dependent oxidoreductase n=1 Tax=Frigidibacter sp. MR17.24 TaxID=3127345 RepID=UPI0030129D99
MQSPSPLISTALVIGGGIFGVSTAAHLARMGVAVTLVNDGPLANGASGRSLAWLNSSRRRSMPYHRLRQAGIERYRVLADRHPGADWLRFCGGLTWDAEDDTNEIAAVFRHEREIGYPAELLSAPEVGTRIAGVEAGTVTGAGAILNPNEGWVDLPALIGLLAAEITAAGGTIVTDAGAAEPLVEAGRCTGARCADGRRLGADAVLVATGPAVPAMAAAQGIPIGDDSPIALLVETEPLAHPLATVLNTPRVAIRPTPGGAYYLDSGWSEEEVVVHPDGRYEALPSTVAGLIDEARRVMTGAPALAVRAVHMGPKPIPGGGEPVFGALAALPGCFVAFSHSGATLGLIAGELLAEEMALGLRHPLFEPFRPGRFAA